MQIHPSTSYEGINSLKGRFCKIILLILLFGDWLNGAPESNQASVQPALVKMVSFPEGASAADVRVDVKGNIYLAGHAKRRPPGGGKRQLDAFVAKFTSKGFLVYATFIGGTGNDYASDVAIDRLGNAYISGDTESNDFPVLNAFQPAKVNNQDAFVAKIDPQGSVVYSTYVGGSSLENAMDIAADRYGNAYVVGLTTSGDFPVVQAFQPQIGGDKEGFLIKIDPLGSLVYSTYLGGVGQDVVTSVAVSSNGSAFLTGRTCSLNFPVSNAIQPMLKGSCDLFVSKADASGALIYSTFFGGSDNEEPTDLAIDRHGNLYLTGDTFSKDFPVMNPIQAQNAGNVDVFITKLNADTSAVLYSTYLGCRNGDLGGRIAVDRNGRAFVSLTVYSKHFPLVNPLPGQLPGGHYLILLNHSGTNFLFSTPYHATTVRNLTVKRSGRKFYIAGSALPDLNPATVAVIKKTRN
jgi:hypothetical protein